MRRSLWVLILVSLCAVSALGQEYPVEIELTPPDSHPVVIIEEPLDVLEMDAVGSVPQRPLPSRVCRVCDQKTVPGHCSCFELLDQPMAEELLEEISASLSPLGLKLNRPARIKAVSRRELQSLGGERLLGLYQDNIIYVNFELERREARGVIAHEFGHAWFFQHRRDVNSPGELVFEGFPEFVSFLALTRLGDKRAADRIAYEDQTVYGRGARRFIALYRKSGLPAVINQALYHDDV